jgi:hypothetical protein
MLSPPGSPALIWSFTALCIFMAILFVVAVRHAGTALGESRAQLTHRVATAAVGIGVLMAITGGAAASGLLAFGPLPPRTMLVVFATFALTVRLGLTGFGERLARGLSWSALTGFQAFRIPVELFLWQAYVQKVIPVQMTFEGLNFDILSGIGGAAVAVVAARGKPPRWLLWVYNVGGLLLLINIIIIAIGSMPTPLRFFNDGMPNTFVSAAPYIWLPVVLVQAALLGHIVAFRKLKMERDAG